jgi:hypothetical protein
MMLKLLVFIFPVSALSAVYNCNQSSPRPSQFFDRKVQIECDLDAEANPKFVVLAGSSKVALRKKARFLGPDSGNLYVGHEMTALDGQIFEIHTATAMFTETAQASFFTVEPGKESAFWVCRIEDLSLQ